MLKFGQYLEIVEQEVKATTRTGISHLKDMKPDEFVAWMRQVKIENNGILKNIKCVSKIDGLGARFGKDLNGKPFFEGSRTGPIFDSGAFTAFARGKSDDVELIARASHYDDMLEIFKTYQFMDVIPNNTKVACEIFYNPMAEETETGIKFVTVVYDKNKLGSLMTIMPYTILESSTGREHPNKDAILTDLYKESNSKIKIIDPNLKLTEIDITSYVDAASSYSDESLAILKSRKMTDKEAKQNLLNVIQKVKDDLSDYILQHPGIEGKFKLGPEIEGIVLHIPNKQNSTSVYKITTDTFKTAHSRK